MVTSLTPHNSPINSVWPVKAGVGEPGRLLIHGEGDHGRDLARLRGAGGGDDVLARGMAGLRIQLSGCDGVAADQAVVDDAERIGPVLGGRRDGAQLGAVTQEVVVIPQGLQVAVGHGGPVNLSAGIGPEKNFGADSAGVAHGDAEDPAVSRFHGAIASRRG